MTTDFSSLSQQLERSFAERLALRPVSLADAWPLHQATRNPAFNEFLLWDQPETEADTLARVGAIVDGARRGQLAALSAVVRTTGEWVSLFRFQTYVADPRFVEMGMWTHDRFWHGRYSLELGRLCVDAAFALSNVDAFVGASAPANRSSCRLMELCGLRAGQLVYRRTERGTEVPLMEFRITRDEWLAGRPGADHRVVPLPALHTPMLRPAAVPHAAPADAPELLRA